jgi:hypothetical protein
VPLDTSSSQKFLRAYLNEDYNLLFPLPLRSHPDERDREWSAWVEAGWPVDKPKPAPEASFTMRYHVELVAPPPPGPSAEEIAARGRAGRGQVPGRRTRRADRAVAPLHPLRDIRVAAEDGDRAHHDARPRRGSSTADFRRPFWTPANDRESKPEAMVRGEAKAKTGGRFPAADPGRHRRSC